MLIPIVVFLAIAFSCVSLCLFSFYTKNRVLQKEIVVLKSNMHNKEKELEETNSELCELISATNDIAAKATEENTKLNNRINEIKNQLKDNTDLELATLDQIFDELKNRKSQFLLLRPTINHGVDAMASQVSKHDAIAVLRVALNALDGGGGQNGEGEDWKNGSGDDDWS